MRFFLLLCMIASTNIAQCDEWFRGNIHTHTSLSVTGGSSPDIVAQWYHDHGYNFLVLSNHNLFMDPKNTISKKYNEKKFILIPGQEISGHQTIHLTAINVDRIIPWDFNHPNKSIITTWRDENINVESIYLVVVKILKDENIEMREAFKANDIGPHSQLTFILWNKARGSDSLPEIITNYN